MIPYESFFCGVLYFTGSDFFNKEMRKLALRRGFTLSEYSIRPLDFNGQPGDPLPVFSERDVFNYLQMDYLEPTERGDVDLSPLYRIRTPQQMEEG